jgi:protein-S-isoprenylcysteine O-methyltransferase Ste14
MPETPTTMTAEELKLRGAVVCASGLLYWGGVLIQARRVRKQIGRSPNVKPRGIKEKALWSGWFLVILAWIGQPFLVGTAVTIPGLSLLKGLLQPAGLLIGLSLVTLGYVGTLWTYAVMGNNWRMGVNSSERTTLVRNGPFQWVRHPIYLLQIVILIGVAVLLPTPVSLATVAVHYVCVRLKARDEEVYLSAVHGPGYADYCSQTGSLFPRLPGRRPAKTQSAPPKS